MGNLTSGNLAGWDIAVIAIKLRRGVRTGNVGKELVFRDLKLKPLILVAIVGIKSLIWVI